MIRTFPVTAGSTKPDKEKSAQKIDGIVASIMALGEWMTFNSNNESNPYPSNRLAYERLEDFYITPTGQRRYSDFKSFLIILDRYIKSLSNK